MHYRWEKRGQTKPTNHPRLQEERLTCDFRPLAAISPFEHCNRVDLIGRTRHPHPNSFPLGPNGNASTHWAQKDSTRTQ